MDPQAMEAQILEQSREKEMTQADYWWMQVEPMDKYDGKKGGARRFKCKYCGVERGGAVERVKAHLLGLSGFGIGKCKEIPASDLARMQRDYQLYPTTAKQKDTHSIPVSTASRGRAPTTSSGSRGSASSRPIFGSSSMSHAMGGFTSPQERGKQSTLHTAWHPQRKAQVDAAVARFFYSCGISFNVARSPFFKEMVAEIASFGPAYQPPSYDALREKLLDNEVSSINEALTPFKQKWAFYGVSLVADGWSDIRSQSLEGVLAACRGKPLYIKSTECGVRQKTAPVLCDMWIEAVEYVGPQQVVQFVSDLESTNKAAGALLEQRYPHITWSPCMAHCLNNLLKDIGKLEWPKELLDTCKEVVTFVTRHHFSHALYRKFAKKQLLKYSETRFAYNFLMLRRLYSQRPALKQTVASPEWTAWSGSKSAMGQLCFETIIQEEYWTKARLLLLFCLPIVNLLRLVDGDVPYIGKIYEAMDRMIENIRSIEINVQDESEKKTLVEVKEHIEELAVSRWNQYHSPLHAAAYILDPEFQHKCFNLAADSEVRKGWNEILQKMVPIDERRKVRDALGSYRNKEGAFGWEDAQRDRFNVGAVTWWEDYGADQPDLQSLAIRILSQVCSSSSIERLWSSFSNIHTKKRNRLGVQKADDLVFVNANLRLLTKMKTEYTRDVYIGFHKSEIESGSIQECPLEPEDEEDEPCTQQEDEESQSEGTEALEN